MKNVLITGLNSYVGKSFKTYVEQNHSDDIRLTVISLRNRDWLDLDFSLYDSILNVTGIAHVDVSNTTSDGQKLYFDVNRDLAIEVANKFKADRKDKFSQYIYMSSIIVYGTQNEIITNETIPIPDNFYGKSKLEAEEGLTKLINGNFKVNLVRAPMIYGKNSKGNFPKLLKLSKYSFLFPKIDNSRSMIYIENLAEFIYKVIERSETDTYLFPQNKEWVATDELVKNIRNAQSKTILLIPGLRRIIENVSRKPTVIGRLLNKLFGTLTYSKDLSSTSNIDISEYQIASLHESIVRITQ